MKFLFQKEIDKFISELNEGKYSKAELVMYLDEVKKTIRHYENELKNAKDSMFITYAEIKVKDLKKLKDLIIPLLENENLDCEVFSLEIMDRYLTYLDFELGFNFSYGGTFDMLYFKTDDKHLLKKIKFKAKGLGLNVKKKSGEYFITA
jgi:hypothetical protein